MQTAPGQPDNVAPLGDGEKVTLMLTGPVQMQWPVDYADAIDGMVQIGDIYEVTIRKVPAVGRRIGQAPAE